MNRLSSDSTTEEKKKRIGEKLEPSNTHLNQNRRERKYERERAKRTFSRAQGHYAN